MNFIDMTPAEIDAEWLAGIGPYNAKIESLLRSIDSAKRDLARYPGHATIVARAEAKLAEARDTLEIVNRAKAEAEEPFLTEWKRRGGWSRFYLCTNDGGHIHSSLSCSTLRHGTSMAWLPELSGLTEAEAVEEYGAILCTVCFPSAPVEYTNGVNKKTEAEKAARKAEREEKAFAKSLKAITNPDGSTLIIQPGGYRYEVKTLVTAQRELVNALFSIHEWNTELAEHVNHDSVVAGYESAAEILVAAIAHKTGDTATHVKAEALAKAIKKYNKERR